MDRKRTFRNSALFADCVSRLLRSGIDVRFRANGESMNPAIRDGEVVHIVPIQVSEQSRVDFSAAPSSNLPEITAPKINQNVQIRTGDVVLAFGQAGFKAHRVRSIETDRNLYITQGDSVQTEDTPVAFEQILGRVVTIERHGAVQRLARQIVGKARKVRFKLLNLKWLRSAPCDWLRAL